MMITSIFAGIFTVSRAFSTFLVCILSLAALKTKNHTKKVLNALEKVKIPAKMLVIPPNHIYRYINRYYSSEYVHKYKIRFLSRS